MERLNYKNYLSLNSSNSSRSNSCHESSSCQSKQHDYSQQSSQQRASSVDTRNKSTISTLSSFEFQKNQKNKRISTQQDGYFSCNNRGYINHNTNYNNATMNEEDECDTSANNLSSHSSISEIGKLRDEVLGKLKALASSDEFVGSKRSPLNEISNNQYKSNNYNNKSIQNIIKTNYKNSSSNLERKSSKKDIESNSFDKRSSSKKDWKENFNLNDSKEFLKQWKQSQYQENQQQTLNSNNTTTIQYLNMSDVSFKGDNSKNYFHDFKEDKQSSIKKSMESAKSLKVKSETHQNADKSYSCDSRKNNYYISPLPISCMSQESEVYRENSQYKDIIDTNYSISLPNSMKKADFQVPRQNSSDQERRTQNSSDWAYQRQNQFKEKIKQREEETQKVNLQFLRLQDVSINIANHNNKKEQEKNNSSFQQLNSRPKDNNSQKQNKVDIQLKILREEKINTSLVISPQLECGEREYDSPKKTSREEVPFGNLCSSMEAIATHRGENESSQQEKNTKQRSYSNQNLAYEQRKNIEKEEPFCLQQVIESNLKLKEIQHKYEDSLEYQRQLVEMYAKSTEEKGNLQKKIEELQEKNRITTKLLEEERRESNQMRSKIESLLKQKNELQLKNEEIQRDSQRKKLEYEDFLKDINGISKDEKEKNYSRLDKQNQILNTTIKQLLAKNEELENQIAKIDIDQKTLVNKHIQENQLLKEKVEIFKVEKETLLKQVSQMKQNLKELEETKQENSDLSIQFQEIYQENEKTLEEFRQKELALSSKDQQLKDISKQNQDYYSKIKEKDNFIKQIQSQIRDQQNESKEFDNKTKELESIISQQQMQIKSQEEELREYKNAIQTSKLKYQNLKSREQEEGQKLKVLEQKYLELEKSYDYLLSEFHAQKAIIGASEQNEKLLLSLQKMISKQESIIEQLQKDKNQLQSIGQQQINILGQELQKACYNFNEKIKENEFLKNQLSQHQSNEALVNEFKNKLTHSLAENQRLNCILFERCKNPWN